MRYAMYYNHQTLGDILFIVIEGTIIPNQEVKNGDVVALYKDETLVGINIFNISKIIKIKAKGYIPLLNDSVLKVINNILINAGLEALPKLDNSGFIVSKIIEIEEHPDSEHLHICKVDNGKEVLQVVCGAKNARLGLLTVLALPYAYLPSGKQIVPNKLLGIESYGMLCSGKELALEGELNKPGLIELDETEYKVGDDFFAID